MEITPAQKGKFGELWVFGKLIDKGVNVYTPMVDEEGVDAIIHKKNLSLVEIQVKSTRAKNQAGYFNVKASKLNPKKNFFIVCVDMNEAKSIVKGKPNIWVLSAKDFKSYMTSGCRLPIYETRHGDKEPRCKLLEKNFEAWELLTG